MSQFLLYNGKFIPADNVIISADNRGLRYGDGLFETMKLVDGRLQDGDEHFARLWKGLNLLRIKMPVHLTPDKLEEWIVSLARKNGHLSRARIRLTITRGNGGLYDAVLPVPDSIIQTWELPEHAGQWNSNGLVIGIYDGARKSCDPFSNCKHNNFLPYVMGALEAKANRWNDAVVLNTEGFIADTTIANIFLVKDQTLYTPALSQGCIAGIIRHKLVEVLKRQGASVIEKAITVEELMEADEVFLTNSIHPLRWVKSIGDKSFGCAFSLDIYNRVVSTFS